MAKTPQPQGQPKAATATKKKQRSRNFPLIVGVILIAVAGIGFYFVINGLQQKTAVMVAAKNIPAYSFLRPEDLLPLEVPSDSVTEFDLTQANFDAVYATPQTGQEAGFLVTSPALGNQRIDTRTIAPDQLSFGAVADGERVIGATSSVPGIAGGVIKAGDVVDIVVGGAGANSRVIPFNKVLCVTRDPAACANVLPPGQTVSVAGGDGGILLILAVHSDDVPSIAGQQTTLALNPFCRVDAAGTFQQTRDDVDCKAPGAGTISGTSAADEAQQLGGGGAPAPSGG